MNVVILSLITDLITQMATKVTNRQVEYTAWIHHNRDDSRLGGTAHGSSIFHYATQNSIQLKTYELFILEFFIYIFGAESKMGK